MRNFSGFFHKKAKPPVIKKLQPSVPTLVAGLDCGSMSAVAIRSQDEVIYLREDGNINFGSYSYCLEALERGSYTVQGELDEESFRVEVNLQL